MKREVREWVDKADADYHSAAMLFRARRHPNYDGSCFHAQQCAEKYMKAVLQEHGETIDRTHNLIALLDKLTLIIPMWQGLRSAATALTDFAVRFRYPGNSADKPMARDALRACEFIRTPLRSYLIQTLTTPRRKSKAAKRRRKK